ncbi:MAG: alpha-glucan family phosphorylase [Candidatus Margulisiibacteriota bacterium]|jgi:starch phosphorylase
MSITLNTFEVSPNLPHELDPLKEIAGNLWFSWNYYAIEVFRQIDPDIWEGLCHGPQNLLNNVNQKRLDEIVKDEIFISYLKMMHQQFKDYFKEDPWFNVTHKKDVQFKEKQVIAYFSMEYGIDETIPIYSGGLGILAGDHLKAASDLGVPLVAVGLLYQQGYFRQLLNSDGWQTELYPENQFYNMPLTLMTDDKNQPILIDVPNKDKVIYAQIWRCQIGRVPLFLLDTNINKNNLEDRNITAQLYGGDIELRIKQEILIGIGGINALSKLGYEPLACHMNEGHSAFLSLARIANLMNNFQLSKIEAIELVKASNVFTTHTPVPAGNDRFEPKMVYAYLEKLLTEIGFSEQEFYALGRENPSNPQELFCMTVLALKLANFANGVSELHGHVSRKMWQNIWPNLPTEEIPIRHITNGVHIRTWISHDLADLYDFYLGPKWGKDPKDTEALWDRVVKIPDTEFWGTHERRRERLVSFARKRLATQMKRRGSTQLEVRKAEEVLNPRTLTIGFAKRFATYKRADLIFRDLDRLKKILLDKDRPVQLIFAGKAHPLDTPGKKLIQRIVHFAREEELRNHIVFLEDYDMSVARYLVQGCDVWLNNPIRPLEASGTSGMKAAANGVLNCSVLDGWWCEAYNTENGWAIGAGEEYTDQELQDNIESSHLYDLLEKEIVPLFYNRGFDGLPREWVTKMKNCIKTIAPVFSTSRMVSEYAEKFYIPALSGFENLSKNNFQSLKDFTQWKNNLKANWGKIKIISAESDLKGNLKVGDVIEVSVKIQMDGIDSNSVVVQLLYGIINSEGKLDCFNLLEMNADQKDENGICLYKGQINCLNSGKYGYTVRIIPKNELLPHPYEPGLITWRN